MRMIDILRNLCQHDDRNPEWSGNKAQSPCHCDNCYFGRHALAAALLKVTAERDELQAEKNDARYYPE